jgi:pimeloyl-ACP methyl ester carboxylesterase
VPRSAPIDGFSLAYDRSGLGSPVLLLHGWPGTRRDFRALVPLLTDAMEVVVPDLRGFGESDKHAVEPCRNACERSCSRHRCPAPVIGC